MWLSVNIFLKKVPACEVERWVSEALFRAETRGTQGARMSVIRAY